MLLRGNAIGNDLLSVERAHSLLIDHDSVSLLGMGVPVSKVINDGVVIMVRTRMGEREAGSVRAPIIGGTQGLMSD